MNSSILNSVFGKQNYVNCEESEVVGGKILSSEESESLFEDTDSKKLKDASKTEFDILKDEVLASNSKLGISDVEDLDTAEAIKLLQEDDAANERGVSVNTEKKATMKEHREIESDFINSYLEAAAFGNGTDSELISNEDKITLKNLAIIASSIESNTYFMTDKLETYKNDAASLLGSMQTSVETNKNELNIKGNSILAQMKNFIKLGEQDKEEGKPSLTEKEYSVMEKDFESAANVLSAYNTLQTKAESFGCFA